MTRNAWPAMGKRLVGALEDDNTIQVAAVIEPLGVDELLSTRTSRQEQLQQIGDVDEAIRALSVPFSKVAVEAIDQYVRDDRSSVASPAFDLRDAFASELRR